MRTRTVNCLVKWTAQVAWMGISMASTASFQNVDPHHIGSKEQVIRIVELRNCQMSLAIGPREPSVYPPSVHQGTQPSRAPYFVSYVTSSTGTSNIQMYSRGA